MTDKDTNKIFKEIADAYINVGNEYLDEHDSNLVGSSFIYGAARFSAFIVASGSRDLEHYKENKETAVSHFTAHFQQMLQENLDNYESSFEQEPKYKKYMKE